MVYFPPIGSTTPLPLCGEWILVQLNPAAMVKHLDHPNAPKLVQEFSTLPLHTYIAVFRRYLEIPSDKKPWHMCELFLMHRIDFAGQMNEAAKKESIVPAHEAETKDKLFPPKSKKDHYVFQNIFARIRTRTCPLPRDAPHLMHEEVWPRMRDHLMMRSNDLPKLPIECRKAFMERLDDPEFQPSSIAGEDAKNHPWDQDHTPGICLLPHFDYTFDLRLEISQGQQWENEHTYVIKKLLEFVPTIPRVVRLPVRTVEYTGREFYVEHQKSRDPQLALLDRLKGDDNGARFKAPPPPGRLHRASDHIFGVFDGIGKMIKPDKRPEIVTIERTYEYQVEKPTDGVWIRVPAKIRINEEADGEEAKKKSEIKVQPPVRRQSIIPAARTKSTNGIGFIDEKFYVPFVDEVALDVNVVKALEPDEGARWRRSRLENL